MKLKVLKLLSYFEDEYKKDKAFLKSLSRESNFSEYIKAKSIVTCWALIEGEIFIKSSNIKGEYNWDLVKEYINKDSIDKYKDEPLKEFYDEVILKIRDEINRIEDSWNDKSKTTFAENVYNTKYTDTSKLIDDFNNIDYYLRDTDRISICYPNYVFFFDIYDQISGFIDLKNEIKKVDTNE